MDNQTKNSALVFCAVVITIAICFTVITDQIDRHQVKKFLSESVSQIGQIGENLGPEQIVALKNKEISKLKRKNSKLLAENRRLKHRFRYQIEAEKQKANIKWSDGSTKPKYNQVQEGIGK